MWQLWLCYIFSAFQTDDTISILLSVPTKWKRQAVQPPFLSVPVPLAVHPIVAQLSSEWSTRRGRIRDDSSTPARYPETPSVTSLRWKWKAANLFSIFFSCFLAFAQSVSSLFTKHLNNWNKSLQLYVQANQTLFSLLQWADLHFPSCHHGKRCLMRTVLKLGPNNGRNFYTCSFQKGKQCDFFQWAENGPGVSILPGC